MNPHTHFHAQQYLYYASKDGDLVRVRELLGAMTGANLDPTVQGFCSPLHTAGTAEVALELVRSCFFHMEQRQHSTQQTPLHTAARNGNAQVVEVLLSEGASVSARDVLMKTPLHHASIQGGTETIRLLLDHGADANALDQFGRTPVCLAASQGMLEALQLLLKEGAHATGALHAACRYGRLEAVHYLLGEGAGVNDLDKDGQTPLELAREGLSRQSPLDEEAQFEEVIDMLEKLQTAVVSKAPTALVGSHNEAQKRNFGEEAKRLQFLLPRSLLPTPRFRRFKFSPRRRKTAQAKQILLADTTECSECSECCNQAR